jgi:hypothetical protein
MKNPENAPLRIVDGVVDRANLDYGIVLALLAVAESNLVRAGKDSALNHFIAIVKGLERLYGFTFQKVTNPEPIVKKVDEECHGN